MSESYEGLLSSLPGVEEIEVTSADAERDISQITACLRKTGGQQLARLTLEAPTSLQRKMKEVSRETMRRLGTLIKDQTNNLQMLVISGVTSGDEKDLVALIECCRHAKALDYLLLLGCGSRGGRLESYAKDLLISKDRLRVVISHEMSQFDIEKYHLSTEMTIRLWSSLSSFTSMSTLTISDSSLSFPPSPPELSSVTRLEAERVTSQSYEGLLSSLPGLKYIKISIDDAERDVSQITAGLRRTGRQQLTSITIKAPEQLPLEKKNISRETVRGLSLLIREQTKNLQNLSVSGVKCIDDDCLDLIESSTILPNLHFRFLGWGSLDYKRNTDKEPTVTLGQCQLSTEVTIRLWTCLRSFPSLIQLTISDSSLSFPPSPPELTSVTKLEAERVTSQSYEGLLSSLPGLEGIDIIIDDAEGDISQIMAGLCRTGRQELTSITIKAPEQLPLEKKNLSRETMKGLSLLIREHVKRLESLSVSGVKCIDEDYVDLIKHVQCSKILRTLHFQFLGWGSLDYEKNTYSGSMLKLDDCQLSTEMTIRLWTCLKSFTLLIRLTISDSSLSFPQSPPELTSVTKLEAERVTSQSFEGLLSSLPGLKKIYFTIDDAEGDISQITACLRRTGGQQLQHIYLQAQDSLPQEKKTVSRETMRGLGLLIREQTKNLQWLRLTKVKCTDEDDLVDLIECCRHVKTMKHVELSQCGTKWDGRLASHLESLPSSGNTLTVRIDDHDYLRRRIFNISRIH